LTDFFGTLKGRTLMNFLKAMFGNYSKREVKRVQPICDKVLALEDKYAAMRTRQQFLKKDLPTAKQQTIFSPKHLQPVVRQAGECLV